MNTLPEKLRRIVDTLLQKAWKNAVRDQEGEFLLHAAHLAPGTSPESIHETLQVLYRHARRWAPGLEVPFFVPPIRIDVTDAAGNFVVDEESYASVGVAAEFVGNAPAILAILSHEACHHILMQSGLARADDSALNEITTDLAMFVCGFGDMVLRGHSHAKSYAGRDTKVHLGYLSSEEYRQAHEYVLARRVAEGLPAHSDAGARAAQGSRPPTAPEPQVKDGTVEIWCGEALCKRSFRAPLRTKGKPWPVQCPVCGVYLYPSDVLRNAAAGELEPQRAELRFSSDEGLAAVTSTVLQQLARPPEQQAPVQADAPERARADGAALLAEMIADASQPLSTPLAVRPPASLSRPPARSARIARIAVPVLVILVILLVAWGFFLGR